MARRVFFSFHYQRDIWRVNQIRNMDQIVGCSAAGFQDASLWEEAKAKGESAVKRLIDQGLENTSVTVVCIGSQSSNRKYINYEIDRSIERGNGILGIRINHLRDMRGLTDPEGSAPVKLVSGNYSIYRYSDNETLKTRIEAAARSAGR